MKRYSLTESPVTPTLVRFAVPLMLSALLQSLYGATDLFVVGQYADAAAVSGVSIGTQLMSTVTMLIYSVSMGGTVLLGNCIGEKNDAGAARAVGTMTVLFALITAVLTPLMLFGAKAGVALMQTPAEAVADTRSYVRICSLGLPFIIGYNAVSGVFRGLGDSKTPVYFVAMACGVNIAADFLLVGRFGMGASGAALATVGAQGLSFLAALGYMIKSGFPFPFSAREHLRLHGPSLRRILRVGGPLALQNTTIHLSFLIITAIINTMGLVASAAVGVVEKILSFAFLPPDAFAGAVAAMTAQNMGANKPKRATDALWRGIAFSLAFGLLFFAYCNIAPRSLTGIFTRDRAVIEAAAGYLRTYSLDCAMVSFVFCFNSYFSGQGNAVISMIHNMAATFLVRIPLTLLMSRLPNTTMVHMGLAAPAASLLSVFICAGYFLWLRRKREKTTG